MNTALEAIKQDLTERDILELIVYYFNSNRSWDIRSNSRRNLWDILTALRGPDSDISQLKQFSTSRLRAEIGLERLDQNGFLTRSNPLSTQEKETLNTLLDSEPYHFQRHWKAAEIAFAKIFGRTLEPITEIEQPEGYVVEFHLYRDVWARSSNPGADRVFASYEEAKTVANFQQAESPNLKYRASSLVK